MTHVGAILAMALCVVVCGHLGEGGVWIKSNEEEKVFKCKENEFVGTMDSEKFWKTHPCCLCGESQHGGCAFLQRQPANRLVVCLPTCCLAMMELKQRWLCDLGWKQLWVVVEEQNCGKKPFSSGNCTINVHCFE